MSIPKYLSFNYFAVELRSQTFASQDEVARELNFVRTTITKYETGKLRPAVGYLAFLAQAYINRLEDEDEATLNAKEELRKELNVAIEANYERVKKFSVWDDVFLMAQAYKVGCMQIKSRKTRKQFHPTLSRETSTHLIKSEWTEQDKYDAHFVQAADNSLQKSVTDAGLIMYYSSRETTNYVTILKDAKEKFDCIGTSLPDIAADQCWKVLRQQLSQNQNLIVRILLLNPKSVIAYKKRKSNIYKHQWKDIVNDIHNSINVFKSIRHELHEYGIDISNRYDVRVYSTIPTTSCVFNDSILNISFYDEIEPASINPVWVFKKGEDVENLYNYYQRNLDVIWKHAISIFDDNFEKKIEEMYREELKSLQDQM